MYEYKSKIDRHFAENWTETPVELDGIHFDVPVDKRWISVKFVPYARDEKTFGAGVIKERGLLKVFAYDTSATLAYVLAKKVLDFYDEYKLENCVADVGYPDGQGVEPLHDGIFETLVLFDLTLYETRCSN